jgi:hypothetical protein
MTDRTIPWHSNGTKLNSPSTAADALRLASLGWRVLKTTSFEGANPPPGRTFVVREDLWSRNEGGLLGTVPVNNEPMQQHEAFGLFDPIVANGAASYDAAGVMGEYTWPWMVLRLSGDSEIVPGDSIGRFILFLHSPATCHYRLHYLPVRLAGANTVAREDFHNPDPRVTIPNDRPRRFEAPLNVALQRMHDEFDIRIKEFRAMARVKLSQEILQRYLNVVFDDWINKLRELKRTEDEASKATRERDSHLQECVRLFEEGSGNGLLPVKGTLWAACSAVTEYVDFFKLSSDDSNYLPQIWFDRLKESAIQMGRQLTRAGRAETS